MEILKIGTKLYKICPICNNRHRESKKCSDCAWGGCFGVCDVGVSMYSDGSGCGRSHDLHIVEKEVNHSNLYEVHNKFNIMWFTDEAEAEKAMHEYKVICHIAHFSRPDPKGRKKMLDAYDKWYDGRRQPNPFE